MVTKHMAHGGRICICGSIANYNDTEKQKCTSLCDKNIGIGQFSFLVPQINFDILSRELTIRGIIITSYQHEMEAALREMVPLVKKVRKDVFEDLKAFELLRVISNSKKRPTMDLKRCPRLLSDYSKAKIPAKPS